MVTGKALFTFTARPAPVHIFRARLSGMMGQEILSCNPATADATRLHEIRKKFRDVFGCDTTMNDETLAFHYRVAGNGDLIMILR